MEVDPVLCTGPETCTCVVHQGKGRINDLVSVSPLYRSFQLFDLESYLADALSENLPRTGASCHPVISKDRMLPT